MALSLDDKILGEKVDNYCSSSEDEHDDKQSDGSDNDEAIQRSNFMREKHSNIVESHQTLKTNGSKYQTGPKGVLDDYKDFKEMEKQKKMDEQLELMNLYSNLSSGLKTNSELEAMDKDEEEFRELLEGIEGVEDILAEFHDKRMNEMRTLYMELPIFEKVYELDADTFTTAIDKEHRMVSVIIHLYEPKIDACDTVKGCFLCLYERYPHVKFCNLRASSAKMSEKFLNKALPALIIYKGGELIGNIIQLDKYLGLDFFANELEQFLQEHSFIPDKVTDQACKLSTYNSKPSNTSTQDDYNID